MTQRGTIAMALVAAVALACAFPGLPDTPAPTPEAAGSATSTEVEPSATAPPLLTPTVLHGEWPLYFSAGCAFTIRYPPGGVVITPEDSVRIDLPFTPGTNLQEKYLDITCRISPPVCESVYASGYDPAAVNPHAEVFNGIGFLVQNASEGAAGNFYDWIAYSAAKGSACASLTFILHSTNALNYDPPLAEFDKAGESEVFTEMMNTFGWGP